ncbi:MULTISPECIES: hypothetical protein [unclassified Mesorhizobium]|uniref:hypothetical protein n=1 Tax=unclassified Mesorhizobium TaxID=325217 RepID=UPI00115EE618|nr:MULTISPECIES: hypothetical protein [unclassified Mesorhizobium]TRD02079.1 hypothetical protein FJV82_18665 [Mesorhizobium sp. WSM4305]
MNHLQGTRSKCLRFDFTFTERRPSIVLHGIFGGGCNAMLPVVSSILILLLASPANSQLAPDASATAAANGGSPVAVSERTDIAKGDDEQAALRRELAAARAELARQAQALKAQQRTDEALTLNLETAQRAIENFRAEASLWDSKKAAMPEAPPSVDGSQVAATQALDEERHKVGLLEQELATARQTIDALKAGENLSVAEQAKAVKGRQQADDAAKQALDEERHKVGLLEQELATARHTIDALKTGANLAAAEQAKAVKDRQQADDAAKQARKALELERQRADSAMRALDIARKQSDALKQSSMDLSAALDQERERANGLARSLSAARDEIDSAKIDSIREKRRTAAVVRAPKAGVSKSALASSLPVAAHQPGLPKKWKVKGRRSAQAVLLATMALPPALLPTRPLSQ